MLESLRTVMERGDFEDYFKECDEKHVFPQKAADALVEAGFASLGIPEEYDGTPVDILTQVMVAEEAHALGYPSLCWINFSTEVDDILTFGNPEQQKAVLEYAVQGKNQARWQGVHQRHQDVQHERRQGTVHALRCP